MGKVCVIRQVWDAGDRIADGNRALFEDKGIFVIKLMSSPCECLEEWFDLIGIMIEDFKKSHP